ncbi:MAG: OmpL47-type beta-barrel domain-containing protein [Thermoplasmata archaeon]
MLKISKIIGIGIVIACVLSVIYLPTASAVPAITLTPDTGVVYSQVLVNGTGFSASVTVGIFWENFGNLLNTTTTTSTGSFSCYIQIQEGVVGQHTVIARDAAGRQATAIFTIIPSISISPSSGTVGSTVTLYLRGFAGNTWVDLSWDGKYWTSIWANNLGSATQNRDIPQLTGGWHLLSATDEDGNTATTQFLVISNIVLRKNSGVVGEIIDNFTCTGFGANTEVRLYMDSIQIASAATNNKGTATGSFEVPVLPGGTYNIIATDDFGNAASTIFSIDPSIHLSQYAGFVYDTIQIYGYGFSAGKNVTVLWDWQPLSTVPSQVVVENNGSFECRITIPDATVGAHTVTAQDETGFEASASFSVHPSLAVSPNHGIVGIFVNLTGKGFAANVTVNIFWDYGLPTQQNIGSTTTNDTGGFTIHVNIPSAANGTHRIAARDANNNIAYTLFYLGPTILLNPTSGNVGTSVSITGYVFSANANVTIYWDAASIGKTAADSNGDFTYMFSVPHTPYGAHIVSAIDEYGVSANATFFVEPKISIVPASGTVGSNTTISGAGFSANSIVYIYWDGVNTYRSEKTNSRGDFLLTYLIPESTAGDHTVEARDIAGISDSTVFTVLPSIGLSKSSGYVGENFTVYCHGFGGNLPATLVWDNVSTQYYSITNGNGYAEIFAKVPLASAGPHNISVYDSELNTVMPLVFTVLSPDAPIPLSPSGFINTSSATLSWSAIETASLYIGEYSTDPTFNTDVTHFYTPTNSYTISNLSDGATYYWHVKSVDAANNEGNFSQILNFTVDLTPPITTISAPEYTNARQFNIMYSSTDTVSGVRSVSLYYSFNFTDYVFWASCSQANGAFTFTPQQGDGIYSFYAVGKDFAGNSETAETTLTVIVDFTKPWAYIEPLPPLMNSSIFNLTLVYGDAGSGVSIVKIFYSMDNGNTWVFYGNYTENTIQFVAPGDGTYIFQAVAIDKAGNEEDFGTAESQTIVDCTPPQLILTPDGSVGNDGWYLTPVKLKISSASTENVTVYYRIDGSEWLVYNGEIFISSEGTHVVEYYGVDSAGNANQIEKFIAKIDMGKPFTTHDPITYWYNTTNVLITFSASDNTSGVKYTKVKIDDGLWLTLNTGSASSPITITGEGIHTVKYYSVDIAGNAEETQEFFVRIDTTPPFTKAVLSGHEGKNGWYLGNVSISLSACDELSGVAAIYYSIDGASFIPYKQEIVFSDGVHTLSYYAMDNAGNVEAKNTISIRIDKGIPFSSVNVNSSWYTTLPLSIKINATDATSGIAGIWYSIDGMGWINSDTIEFKEEGVYTIQYFSEDIAGNVEMQKTATVKIDLSAPKTSNRISGIQGLNGWYRGTVKVELFSADNVSGVKEILVSVDNSEFFAYTTMLEITEEGVHTLKFYAVDFAGNTENEHVITIYIDHTPPKTTLNLSQTWYSTPPGTVHLLSTDTVSGVATTCYRINGGVWVFSDTINFTEDGIYEVEFYSVDIAGNAEELQKQTVRIDTANPIVYFRQIFENNAAVSGKLLIEFSVIERSGVASCTYSIDNTTFTLYPSGETYKINIDTTNLSDGPHTLVIVSTDFAGHNTTIVRNFLVDNSAPVISSFTPSKVSGIATLVIVLEDASNISEYTIEIDGKAVMAEKEGNTIRYTWTTSVADNGKHTVRITVKDALGNQETYERTIYVDNPDFTPYLSIIALFVGLAIVYFSIHLWRKKTHHAPKWEEGEFVEVKK